jgi:NADPH:quinone reductase-like Zn-dependent oxidoreductase
MQAILLDRHGPPDVLRVQDAPDPQPAPGETVVELRAIAVNRRDTLLRSGATPDYQLPLPFVLGSDGAGIRRDTGEEVLILPSLHWGGDEATAGPDFEILGGPSDGTYAELVAVPIENLYPRPASLSWEAAAALPLASLTAHRALFAVGRLRLDERLVLLGTGAVSIAALQLAVAVGARVAITSSSAEKLAWAREAGAECTVDYRDERWVDEIGEAFGPADVVLDAVGPTWPQSIQLLGPGGRLVACGGTAGGETSLDVRTVYLQQKQILGTKMGSPADFEALLDLVAEFDLQPLIDSVRPLSEAASAHDRIEAGTHFGKLVLDPKG